MARFLFLKHGIDFEDYRVDGEEWVKMKPTLLTKTLPLLEVDGNIITGSGPINRYLATEFGLYGNNSLEKAKIEAIVDVVDDLYLKILATYVGDDASKEAAKKALKGHIKFYFGILEEMISANDSSKGCAFGDKLTYADLSIAANVEPIIEQNPAIANEFPVLKSCVTSVTSVPRISDYLKDRPESFF